MDTFSAQSDWGGGGQLCFDASLFFPLRYNLLRFLISNIAEVYSQPCNTYLRYAVCLQVDLQRCRVMSC